MYVCLFVTKYPYSYPYPFKQGNYYPYPNICNNYDNYGPIYGYLQNIYPRTHIRFRASLTSAAVISVF